MARLAAIRDAIKTLIEAELANVHVYARIGSVQILPAVVVYPVEADYLQVMDRAHMEWPLDLYVLVSPADTGTAQYELDELIDIDGPRSLVRILHNDDLELPETQTHVRGVSGYGGAFESAGVDHVGAVLRLVVHTKGAA